MARYIDVDKVELKGLAVFDENLDVLVPLSVVRKALQMTPTADVVPKSVADEIAEELSDTIIMKDQLFDEVLKLRGGLENAKQEVAREIFEEIEKAVEDAEFEWGTIYGVKLCVAELKKKYTGDQT